MNWKSLLSSQRVGSTRALTPEQSRSSFEQDYDRIIFSHAFRKLQDKTQVHPLPEHDFVHTRLTHSLEVSSVGRSLGRRVGDVILQRHSELPFTLFDFGAIVAAASLAHDLGNPPFGHAGEDAISDFFVHHPQGAAFEDTINSKSKWKDLITFEGNAQGFRILNKNQQHGLSLTYGTLGAFTKYPCPALFEKRDKSKKSQKKFGYFQSERIIFQQIATQLELPSTGEDAWCRHPLAFLVEAADDICYNIIDLEDGCRLGLVSLDETIELLASILREDFNREKLDRIPGHNEKIGVLRALAIGKLIDQCCTIFLDNEKGILDGTFDQALADHCPSRAALDEISKISVERIYRARHVLEIEASGHEVLPGLLAEFTEAGRQFLNNKLSRKYANLIRLLPEETIFAIRQQPDDSYNMLRNIIDFVSGLTDRYALHLYQKIKGISLQ